MLPLTCLFFFLLPLVDAAPLTATEKEYLQQFGFLEPARILAEGEVAEKEETREENAIKMFQEYSGLDQTGKMDDAGRKLMDTPQCGKPTDKFFTQLIDGKPKWNKTDITYSFYEDQYLFPEEYRNATKKAFAAFAAIIPLKFREVETEGDIVLAFGSQEHLDCDSAFDGTGKVLAHALEPEYGIVHFDGEDLWTMMNATDLDTDGTDFLSVAMHEIGHALGLDHSRKPGALMHRFYSAPINAKGKYKEPTIDKEAKEDIQQLYGTVEAPKKNKTVDNGGCAKAVYAAMSFPNYRVMLFPDKGTKILELQGANRRIIARNVSVSDVFFEGPSMVEGAYYDATKSRVLLFFRNQVWAYSYNSLTLKVNIIDGYPKTLPAGDEWRTGAAFAVNGELFLRNYAKGAHHHHFATYTQENWLEPQGHIEEVFPGLSEYANGFAQFGKDNWIGFRQETVFKYDFAKKKVTENLGAIRKFLHC